MKKKKLVVAGKIIDGKKDIKTDSEFFEKQALNRSGLLSETEAILPKPPSQARFEMTGI